MFVWGNTNIVRDWSLITGRGPTKWDGGSGMWSFTPSKRRGGKSCSHAEGGGGGGGAQNVLGVVFTR